MWDQLQTLSNFVMALLIRVQDLETRVAVLEQQVAKLWARQQGN